MIFHKLIAETSHDLALRLSFGDVRRGTRNDLTQASPLRQTSHESLYLLPRRQDKSSKMPSKIFLSSNTI